VASRTTRTQDGRLLVREGGRWRAASRMEELNAEVGPVQAFGLGVASVPGGLAQQYRDLQTAAMGGQSATFGPVPPRQASGPEQAARGVSQFQPGAVMAGQLAPNLIGLNPVGAGRAVSQGTGRMAERVMARAQQQSGGLEMTLGEKTGSGVLQRMESAVGSQGGFDALKLRRDKVYNRSASRIIGQNADEITPDVLRAGDDAIGAGMDEVLNQPFQFTPQTREAMKSLPNPGAQLGRLLQELDEMPGEVPGAFVKNLRRQLGERGSKARGTDDLMADDYEQAMDALMLEIGGQLPEGAVKRWQTLRQQYLNLKLLESLPEVRNGGRVTPRQASSALARKYGTSYLEGRGTPDAATNEFMDLTRQLSGMKALPDSGTATRLGPLVGITAGAASGDDVGDAAGQAALYGTLGYLLPVGLGRASIAAARYVR